MAIDQENHRLSNAIVGAKKVVPRHDDYREMGKQEFLQYQISKHTKPSTVSRVDARINFLKNKMNALPKIDCGQSFLNDSSSYMKYRSIQRSPDKKSENGSPSPMKEGQTIKVGSFIK